tara:strand:- start:576 stop:1583 length:1008 start_codon:yes stop_codon:yes gene_type:complete
MKFALMMDDCAINSYYIKDKVAYDFNDNPYVYHHAVSPECFSAMQNLPFIFEEGYFFNWAELDELPDVDFDLIFYDNGKIGLDDKNYDKFCVDRLRDKYPKAKIFGWIKEVWVGTSNNYNHPRHLNRIKFLNECDAVITSGISTFKRLDVFTQLKENVNKKFNFIGQPVNTDYLYDNFYSGYKDSCIYAYVPNPVHRRGRTYAFAEYIGKKYNIEVRYKPLQSGQKFDYLSLKEFIELWSKCAFHFNLDPENYYPGNQCMQAASVGCINIGGLNESHTILFPTTATCDEKILEELFVEYLTEEAARFKAIEYAWTKLHEIYSFDSVRKQIEGLEY